jgi:Zn-dependent peptidase ImmA (M78 family)
MITSVIQERIKNFQTDDSVNVTTIAENFGLKVYPDGLTEDISGAIVKNSSLGGKSGYCIFYNKNHAPVRQRFTIAHELAHFILHKDLIGDGVTDDMLYRADGFSSKIESQANNLAAEILMPFHLIRKHLNDRLSLKELAKKLEVSQAAIRIRLGIPVFDDDISNYDAANILKMPD